MYVIVHVLMLDVSSCFILVREIVLQVPNTSSSPTLKHLLESRHFWCTIQQLQSHSRPTLLDHAKIMIVLFNSSLFMKACLLVSYCVERKAYWVRPKATSPPCGIGISLWFYRHPHHALIHCIFIHENMSTCELLCSKQIILGQIHCIVTLAFVCNDYAYIHNML